MRKVLYALFAAAAVVAVCAPALNAQKYPGQGGETAASPGALAADIRNLQAQQEKSQRENGAKLDRILANQEKILQELEVVKVRASLRP